MPGLWPRTTLPKDFARRFSVADRDKRHRLAALISHRFLTPSGIDPNHEMLKRAVGLATKDVFRRKRRAFYEWQEKMIQEQISEEKAVEDLETLLKEYNEETHKAFNDTIAFAFTVIPIGLTVTGAFIGGSTVALALAGGGGLVQLSRFWKFDRNPVIKDGDLVAARPWSTTQERNCGWRDRVPRRRPDRRASA